MALVFVLILAQAAIIVPVAIYRGNLKRVLLMAFLLEVGKVLLFLLLVFEFLNWLPRFAALGFFIVFLAEWTASGGLRPVSPNDVVTMFYVGLSWNLGIAYVLASCLPAKVSEASAGA